MRENTISNQDHKEKENNEDEKEKENEEKNVCVVQRRKSFGQKHTKVAKFLRIKVPFQSPFLVLLKLA
jgi:hypothetical protein